MKSPDRTTESLDPEIERQLGAVDRALAGEPVDPDLADLATLTADLRAERAAPPEQWSQEMDAKAGAGFGSSRLRSLRRLLPEQPRRMLLPVGAVATLLVVIGAGISSLRDGGIDQKLEPIPAVEGQLDSSSGSSAEGLFDRQGGAAASEDAVAPPLPGADRTAPGKSKRQQDRSAFLALKTTTNEVREVSDEAIQITESVGGVVLSSNLSEQGKRAQANLELSIPTRELDATLDRLTDLATVKSLNEASVDITRPFVSAEDQLRDARAEREKLLEALGNASTDAEVEAIRGQLKDARRKIFKAEATFDNIARRARTSKVSMTIEGSPEKSDGSWSLGEAADDALSALEVVAGVLLIGAAILAPVVLLVAAITAIALAVRRRRRERALDAD
ncbi:MAG: DUF4349 domain-containing protein [Solirubrobacterales bacterium]